MRYTKVWLTPPPPPFKIPHSPLVTIRPLGYEMVYLEFWKMVDTPFHIQGDGLYGTWIFLAVAKTLVDTNIQLYFLFSIRLPFFDASMVFVSDPMSEEIMTSRRVELPVAKPANSLVTLGPYFFKNFKEPTHFSFSWQTLSVYLCRNLTVRLTVLFFIY